MKVSIEITGTTPLLLHSARTVDPLDPMTKKIRIITNKRKKTDDDHEEIARLEFLAGMYYDEDAGPYLPGENIFRSLHEAGKLTRSGVKVTRGLIVTTEINPLAYKGPRKQAEMYKQGFWFRAPVRVGVQRVMRCRPQIPAPWAAECEVLLDTRVLSLEELGEIAESAGQYIGLCDWRGRFGRYQAAVKEI